MATSNSNIVSILGILAIVILVGLAVYFVVDRNDNDLEIDIGLVHDSAVAPMVA
jgi:hypothetical protein